MGFNLASYAIPGGYNTNVDLVDSFGQGLQFGQGQKNAQDAKTALGEYVRSLYAGGAPGQQPAQATSQLAGSTNPIDRLIGTEHASAAAATDPTLANYFSGLAQRESGGDPNATNPSSSATGLYQITNQTWTDLAKQHPELGLTADGRTDPAQQQKAVRALTQDNARSLSGAGIPVNPGSLYAAHFLGAPTATQVLGFADNTPMSAAVSPDVLQANPQLAQMSVGDFKQWAAGNGAGQGGGYQPPMAQPQGGMPPLPEQNILEALVQNPNTREFGLNLISSRTNPSVALDLQGKQADIALKEAQANAWTGGKPIAGYRVGPDGSMIPIPGGPADPNNPLNYNKTGGMTPPGTSPLGTTGDSTIDATAPGYSSQVVTGGLTQAAIDQKALSYLTSGGNPPIGRSGLAGAQSAAISNRMAELDPNGNLAANKTKLKSLSESLATQQKYLDSTQRSIGNAEAGFQQVVSIFNGKVNTSQYPTVNAAFNAIAAQTDPATISAFKAGLAEVANEYTQVFSRGGQVTDAVRGRAKDIVDGNLSIPALQGVLNELQAQGGIVVKGAQTQVKRISDQIGAISSGGSDKTDAANSPPTPQTQDEYDALPSGTIYTDPDDGQQYRKP